MLEAPSGAARPSATSSRASERSRGGSRRLNQVVSAATHDPDAAAIWTRSEELRRRSGFREAVEHIDGRFGLRDGLDVERATDILLTMGGHAVYCSLVHD